jgi:hypothetical protein
MSEANLFPQDIITGSVASEAVQDIYVNASTGDDINGTGAVGSPYATITRAYEDVSYRLKSLAHIHIAAGAYSEFPDINNIHEVGGRLSFDGSAAIAVEAAGPFTLGAPTMVDATYGCLAVDLPVPAGGLTPGAWDGLFVRVLDGAAVGQIYPVISSTASNVRVQSTWTMPSAGDTFEVVTPGVVITTADSLTWLSNAESTDSSLLAMLGIKIICTGTLTCRCKSLLLSGSILDLGSTKLYDSTWNGTSFLSLTDVSDDTTLIASGSGMWSLLEASSGYLTLYGLSSLTTGAIRRPIDVTGGLSIFSSVAIKNVTADYGVDAYSGVGALSVQLAYVEVGAAKPGIRTKEIGSAAISMYVEQAGPAIQARVGTGALHVSGLTCDATKIVNCVEVGQGVSVTADVSKVTSPTVASDAIKWTSGAVNVALPAANNHVTDSHGAQLVGY